MIRGHMDGLQVLKGGQGKATIYFTKDMMHGALDLNETGVDLTPAAQQEGADGENVSIDMDMVLAAVNNTLRVFGKKIEIRDIEEPTVTHDDGGKMFLTNPEESV